MIIFHKGHTDTIQVYSVTVITHVKALQAGHSSQGTSEPITPVMAGDRSRSLSVCCRWFWVFSEVGRGVKLSAKGERGDVRGSWTPRVRTSRFPFRTDRMSFAGRISRSKTRETGIGCPLGRRPISVSSGSADPMTFLAVFCVPNAGNS